MSYLLKDGDKKINAQFDAIIESTGATAFEIFYAELLVEMFGAACGAPVIEHLQRLGFLDSSELTDSCILRVPYAYPIFNIDYRKNLQVITDWLDQFENLQLIGRSGRYSYLNMDCAMESGIQAVEEVISRSGASATFSEKMAAAASLV